MIMCKATDCPNKAIVSGLCEEHYQDWRTTIDNRKSAKELKTELEKKYGLLREPVFRNLEDFK